MRSYERSSCLYKVTRVRSRVKSGWFWKGKLQFVSKIFSYDYYASHIYIYSWYILVFSQDTRILPKLSSPNFRSKSHLQDVDDRKRSGLKGLAEIDVVKSGATSGAGTKKWGGRYQAWDQRSHSDCWNIPHRKYIHSIKGSIFQPAMLVDLGV